MMTLRSNLLFIFLIFLNCTNSNLDTPETGSLDTPETTTTVVKTTTTTIAQSISTKQLSKVHIGDLLSNGEESKNIFQYNKHGFHDLK